MKNRGHIVGKAGSWKKITGLSRWVLSICSDACLHGLFCCCVVQCVYNVSGGTIFITKGVVVRNDLHISPQAGRGLVQALYFFLYFLRRASTWFFSAVPWLMFMLEVAHGDSFQSDTEVHLLVEAQGGAHERGFSTRKVP